MAANFNFLKNQSAYALFADACIEAERVLSSSPAMAAVGSRRAFELAVKWVYAADNTIRMPYKDNLQSLIHEPTFRFAMENQTWSKLLYIIKLGNQAAHTNQTVSRGDAILSLVSLFEFVQWIDYCYGANYHERKFDEGLIPTAKVELNEAKIKENEALILQKDSEIEVLRIKIESMSRTLTAEKGQHQQERHFVPADMSEFATRKKYIDVDLKLLGWVFGEDVKEEVALSGMPNAASEGYADYVLYGRDKLPLAIVEAKRTSVDPQKGTHQAKLYADCLEKMTGRRPIIFTTNGFNTYMWDDLVSPQRQVSGVFSKADLEKMVHRRGQRQSLATITISDTITDRYYQKEAIRAVSDHVEGGHRKALLVMATGTGKTRTASSLTDVLSRGGHVTNILFLADRTALVKQAKDDFKNYLPDMSLCNLLENKSDKTARIVFSTYPTMLNAIDTVKTKDGQRLFSPAHFDLIIIDEAHRSIFNKYRAIFAYFDAIIVGLTATPKTDVDRNTYEFFELENGVPTFAYDYETAVQHDHVLVPYYNIEVKTRFLEEGITYDQLSDADKERYEEDFANDNDEIPSFIPSPAMNDYIFNQSTVDQVLQNLMERGIRVAGGDRLGKTIIFAQNIEHAQYIVDRFDKLYPQYRSGFAKRIVSSDSYAQSLIDDFKRTERDPHIAVSVDMLDTGIDVPDIVNLVFFKRIRSKTKFWQMIGRGTRLRSHLFGENQHKTHFMIFDYLSNFEFFRQHKEGLAGNEAQSLSEAIFSKRVRLINVLQDAAFAGHEEQAFRSELIEVVQPQIRALNPELISVKLELQHVDEFSKDNAFVYLSEAQQRTLIKNVAPLVYMDDSDEFAKRFDNLMYGLMVAQLEKLPQFKAARKKLESLSVSLSKRASMPQIRKKLELIQSLQTEEFWKQADLHTFEQVRQELRELMKLIIDEGQQNPVYTNLMDDVLDIKEGVVLEEAYDFADYRLKVNRYMEENRDHLVIRKLRHNLQLTSSDYAALQQIFTQDLGTEEDYKREFKETPFGLLVRRIAKLDQEAAYAAFSSFINDQSLSQAQIVFVKRIVEYVVQNGYMEQEDLIKPPFDKPQSFFKLFDSSRQKQLVHVIAQIRENAVQTVG